MTFVEWALYVVTTVMLGAVAVIALVSLVITVREARADHRWDSTAVLLTFTLPFIIATIVFGLYMAWFG